MNATRARSVILFTTPPGIICGLEMTKENTISRKSEDVSVFTILGNPHIILSMMYEISVRLNNNDPVKIALIKAVLDQAGIDRLSVAETIAGGKAFLSYYAHGKRKADFFYDIVIKAGLKGVKVAVRSLEDKDWKSRWIRYYRPVKVTRDMTVVPYDPAKSLKSRKEGDIFIKTDIIFGSGLHETTKYMADLIQSKRKFLGSFLDIGTGTGLLSIIAGKYGARKVSCIDIDPEAVENASFNFKINGINPYELKTMDLRRLRTKKTYDFVAANLLTRDLIDMKDRIISLVCPGKYLAVSGISLDNYRMFRREFKDGSLKCLRVRKGREWVGILYKKDGE